MAKNQLSFQEMVKKQNIKLKAQIKYLEKNVEDLKENHNIEVKKMNDRLKNLESSIGSLQRDFYQKFPSQDRFHLHPNWLLCIEPDYIQFT